MASKQSLIVLGVAIFLGLIAVYLANIYLGAAEERESTDNRVAKVAVARVPLEFGVPVTPEKVQLVDFPISSIPAGAFRSLDQLAPGGNAHVALRPIEVGEPILRSKLSGQGGRASLSALLPPDMRAAAIKISDVSGVAGFVLPGDRVDVFLTRAVGQGTDNRQLTDVLLQDVRVIAIDQDANDNANKPSIGKTATLEVSQVDAQKLMLAQEVGTVSLALRSVKAPQGQQLAERVSSSNLVGGSRSFVRPASYAPTSYAVPIRRVAKARPQIAQQARAAAPAAPNTRSVQIVRGTAGSDYEVTGYRGY